MWKFATLLYLCSFNVTAQIDAVYHERNHNNMVNDVFDIYFDSDDDYLYAVPCDTTLTFDDGLLNCLQISSANDSLEDSYNILFVKLDSRKGIDTYSFIELIRELEVDRSNEIYSLEYNRQVLRVVIFEIHDNWYLDIGGEIFLEPWSCFE